MSATSTIKYPCGVCGKRQTAEQMIFSTHTRQRYCRDLNACRARAKRRTRKREEESLR